MVGTERSTLHGLIADVAGRRVICGSRIVGAGRSDAGPALARRPEGPGADEILVALRGAEQVPTPQPE